VGAIQVHDGDEIMLISNLGTLVRTKADEVSLLGRNTQGVKLIDLRGEEKLTGVQRIIESDEESNGSESVSEEAE
jgi:DNA gyrase subunit A